MGFLTTAQSIDLLMTEAWVKEQAITREQMTAAWDAMLYEIADDISYDAAEYIVGRRRRDLGDFLSDRLNAALAKTGAFQT